MITRPMLATEVKSKNPKGMSYEPDLEALEWPMIATPKVDGIRCLNPDGRILSRSFKPIPNRHIRTTLEKHLPVGGDGELFSSSSFQKVTSDVMSRDGKPDFAFWMFDFVNDGNLETPYIQRLENMVSWYRQALPEVRKFIKLLPFKIIESAQELREYERKVLAEGFEGVILRTPESPYKCGRSTWKERYLLKLKIFLDSEAEVIGMEEQVSNQNELEKNEFGLTKRSGKKGGKVPTGRLGKFLARDIHTGVEFKCGSGQGMTMELRQHIWDNQQEYMGKIFKYKYQPHGIKKLPRIPIWLGFRDPRDM
jgi:DNA ligase-1